MRNFVDHQEQAFGKTLKLIVLLVFAATGTVIATGLVLTYLFVVLLMCLSLNLADYQLQLIEIFGIVSAATAVLIAASSYHKMKQLGAGGKVIANDLGGQLIESSTRNRHEQRVLNVVQEMSVAAGIPAPHVYVLPNQRGINAFAAGLTFDDAVIGVTQGCIERLSRDQLQGVIAHEFSHVLNGDMRLNLRLVGLLHGLLGITLFAEAMLEAAQELITASGSERDAVSELGVGLLMTLAGVMLWPVGLIGALFSMMVMSATSRQREFLADAYAVQFTRNPEGLAGALKVLAGCDVGSTVRSANTLEASHFFFAQGGRWMIGLLATHPPLDERIRRLDPHWDGVPLFEEVDDLEVISGTADANSLALVTGERDSASSPLVSRLAESSSPSHNSAFPSTDTRETSFIVSTDASVEYRRLLQSVSAAWHDVIQQGQGCQTVLLALWLDAMDDPHGAAQPLNIDDREPLDRIMSDVGRLDEGQKLVLFDFALQNLDVAAIDKSSPMKSAVEQLNDFTLDSIAPWAIRWQLRRRLRMVASDPVRPRYGKLTDIQPACEILLSMLCHAGSHYEAMAQYTFQRSVVSLSLREPEFWSLDDLSCERLDAAVDSVAELAPRPRRELQLGLARCLAADQGISDAEAHFMRGFCAALGVPAPDVLPGQAIAPGS